jgi:hypothetical protein
VADGLFYGDSEQRYRNDPAFHAGVAFLERLAKEHGFTPGELKQMAFYAALRVELTSCGPLRFEKDTKEDP